MPKSMKFAPLSLGVLVALLLLAELVLGLIMLAKMALQGDFGGLQRTHLINGNTSVILSIVYIIFVLPIMPSYKKTYLIVIGVIVILLLITQFILGLFLQGDLGLALLLSHLIVGISAIFTAL